MNSLLCFLLQYVLQCLDNVVLVRANETVPSNNNHLTTVCPRSSDPYYRVSSYIKRQTASWTQSRKHGKKIHAKYQYFRFADPDPLDFNFAQQFIGIKHPPVAATETNQTICNRFLRLTCSFLIYQIIHCVHLDVLKVMLFLVKSSSSKYCFGEQLNNEIIRLAHSSKNKLNVNTLKLSRRHSDSKNIKYTVNTTPNKFTHILMVLK